MDYRFANRSEQNMRKYILTIILGAGAGLLLSIYLSEESAIFHKSSVVAISLGIVISYIISYFATLLNRWIPWRANLIVRLLLGTLLYTSISFLVVKAILMLVETSLSDGGDLIFKDEQLTLKLILILTIGFLIYSIVELLIYSYKSYSTGELHKIKAERKQVDLQLNALKDQLSPHFLFNSLNTVSSLMRSEPREAENYIRKLAALYNYTINSYKSPVIKLQEEVNFATDYFHLLKTRYGKQIDLKLNISRHHLQSKIPALVLQMLIENAVKHNVINNDYQLVIDIKSDGQWITVSNNKTKAPYNNTSFKIGLQNIKERYQFLTSRAVKMKNEHDFVVSIPIIE